jgi:uncharacterized membrane protein YGL010W
MTPYFRRQLGNYAEYHRDRWNCAMHVFGIVFLFLAAVLPLGLWPVPVFSIQTTAATIMVVPVLIYWVLLDVGLGLAIAGAAALLLSVAALIVNFASATGVWLISAVLIVIGVTLQVVGHQLFERRQPALVDNPTHLLLGPMFVMAKLFIALGFRHDLAIVIEQGLQRASVHSPLCSGKVRDRPHPHS